ncbi:MAG: InlB B-repeat-containing protein, partial [Prevotella sp.]
INQYTITFDTDGGSEVAAITADYNTAVKAPENPTKTGYTFVAWDKEIPDAIPAEDVTIKATWQINQYTITFDTDGGSEVAAITADYNTAVTAPENPTKTGYTFVAWDKEIPDAIPAEDVTIKATWKINQYTITFDTDGGSEVAAITADYNTAVKAPENPTKTGYTFVAWDKEIPATIPAEDVTIKATWKINQYTVKFVSDEVELKSETLDYGTVIIAPETPVKTGYTFKGWSPAFEDGATVPAEDVTYTAVWEVNKYTITFDTDGGSTVESIILDYGTTIVLSDVPTKEGYEFIGWGENVPSTMPDKDLTLKAQWKVLQFMVTFIVDEETVSEEFLDYGTAITKPKDPVKEGYTFVGWSPEVLETVPAHNVTFTAQFKVNVYTLTYYLDGEVVLIEKVEYGSTIETFTPELAEGKTFEGWQEEIPEVMPAYDVEIHGTTSSVSTGITTIVANGGGKVDVYNLQGRLVVKDADAKRVNELPGGFYIINGVKYQKK